MKPSKKAIKLRRSKRSTNLLKSVLQKSVYKKLPIAGRYQMAALPNCKGDKMSAHFMRLANSIAVRLDSDCKKYVSVHGKSNSRLLDVIDRINGMLAEGGFEKSAHDDSRFELKENASPIDLNRTLFDASEEIDNQDVTSLMEQQTGSSLVAEKSRALRGFKVRNVCLDSVDDLESWKLKLKANITTFIDHTWRYKAHKEIVMKEMIMNVLENGDVDYELPVSSLVSNTSDETSTAGDSKMKL